MRSAVLGLNFRLVFLLRGLIPEGPHVVGKLLDVLWWKLDSMVCQVLLGNLLVGPLAIEKLHQCPLFAREVVEIGGAGNVGNHNGSTFLDVLARYQLRMDAGETPRSTPRRQFGQCDVKGFRKVHLKFSM